MIAGKLYVLTYALTRLSELALEAAYGELGLNGNFSSALILLSRISP